jgi:hypothetical protein
MSPEEKPDGPHGRDEPLEELLRLAQWPTPGPERLARLEQRWRTLIAAQVRRRRQRRVLLAVAAVAAGLLTAVLVWRILPRGEGPEPGPSTTTADNPRAAPRQPKGPRNEPKSDKPRAPKTPEPDPLPPRPSVAASRPANPFETIAFRALTRRKPEAPNTKPDDPLDAALQKMVQDADADLDRLANSLISGRQVYEARLRYEIRKSKGPRRVAAVRLLGRVGTLSSVPFLCQLARVPDLHAAGVAALVRLADPETLARLATVETDAALKRDLVSALLKREEKTALGAYLRLAAAPATREVALELLDQRPDLSRDILFEFLCSPYPCRRQGAALVLGRLDGPETHRRLMEMVARGIHRQEALMALLASPSPDAAQYLARVRSDPWLAGALISAQYQLGMSCL